MGKVISVANQKGGVGKTTSAINIAASLTYKSKKVLLIDLDPQGNATSGCGIDKRALNLSAYDMIISGAPAKNCVYKTQIKNLHIIPSNINLAGAEIEMVSLEKREFLAKNAIDEIKDEFDFIIIDCPPSLGLITLNALVCSDSVLIPVQCEYYALEGLSQLTNTIKLVRKMYNPTLDIEGVLVTMYDARLNLTIQVMNEIKKYFSSKVYKTTIPRNVRLSEAPSFGLPITEYDIHSKGAQAYLELCDEILNTL